MTTVTHILDTSAWLAHLFREPGSEVVSTLLLDTSARVGVTALSIVEVHARIRAQGIEHRFLEVVEEYRGLFAQIVPVDEAVALRAVALRQAATARVPAIDVLIAATAAHHNAILVHRDAHFLSIAEEWLKQQHLALEL